GGRLVDPGATAKASAAPMRDSPPERPTACQRTTSEIGSPRKRASAAGIGHASRKARTARIKPRMVIGVTDLDQECVEWLRPSRLRSALVSASETVPRKRARTA